MADREHKPPVRPIDPVAIPDALKSYERWLGWVWTWDERRHKWTKRPADARTGGAGSSTDATTWCAFDEAVAAAESGDVDGIGFALGETDDDTCFAGSDLDDCRDPATGELSDLARDIIRRMDTYVEVSPTGTGVKLFCVGRLPEGARTRNKDGTVETYSSGRFFVVTGEHLDGTPECVEARQEQLTAVWQQYIGAERRRPQAARPQRSTGDPGRTSDAALAAMLRIRPFDKEQDSSRRLLAVCCRAVEYGLSDEAAIGEIRRYEETYPFLTDWSDDDILQRLEDAEPLVERGSSLRSMSRPRTDVGNAERFAQQHGADLRYCHPWGKWLRWDGRRWGVDTTGEVMRRAKRTARSIYLEAAEAPDGDAAKGLAKWATISEGRERLNATIALARSEQPIPVSVDALDAQPWLLNVENGTIDLRTGELGDHRREDYITKLCPTEYPTDPVTESPLWSAFLNRIFDSNEVLIRYVQRLVGMSLVGEVVEHVLPIFHGSGANGKGVLIRTICGMLGADYAITASDGLLMVSNTSRHPTERADLHGKRLVVAVETSEDGRLNETLVKMLTGGDTIRARRMREDFWEFRPSHSLFVATNHKPIIRGTDHGIWRRIRLVPFQVVIPEPEQDKQLDNKLRAEWPAILQWAVAGCLNWRRNGLQAPCEVLCATNTYRSDMDVIGRWIQERCITGASCEAGASDLYRSYRAWAEEQGEHVETQTWFGLRLAERGYTKARCRCTGRVVYPGIQLR